MTDTATDQASDVFTSQDPLVLFEQWLATAGESEPNDPNAMALATVDDDGLPDVRMVLLKGADREGFVFYTNLESAKGQELLNSGKAALCFHWKSLRRQVRVRGPVVGVSNEEADTYFQSRARDSRIGAWASRQSQPLEGRFELEKEVAKYTAKYAVGQVPRPPHWSGFRIMPQQIEFWRDRPFRLHDRLVFRRQGHLIGKNWNWTTEHLFP
ncbi:MAG: pyridoxamine 5'-phosphate oxidase [Candidatus Phaeomarinobacter sp.]